MRKLLKALIAKVELRYVSAARVSATTLALTGVCNLDKDGPCWTQQTLHCNSAQMGDATFPMGCAQNIYIDQKIMCKPAGLHQVTKC